MGEPNEEQCAPVARLVEMHMQMCALMSEERLREMDAATEERYLSFELGVIEYYHRAFLLTSEENNNNDLFFEFLIYYATEKYTKMSNMAFNFWRNIAVNSLNHDERRLGFESVSHRVNEDGSRRSGHAPQAYFMSALGFND